MATTTVIRSRTVNIDGQEYLDIVFTEIDSRGMDVKRHIYRVYEHGTWLARSTSFSSEQRGCDDWNGEHTVAVVTALNAKGQVA